MNFKELLAQLEERLGYHQFPVNPAATNIKNVFEGSPLHHDMMTGLARSIYVANACRRLTDPVILEKTLQALAPIRQETLRAARTDVDLYRLLDELGTALNEIFAEGHATIKLPAPPNRRSAIIIPLAPYRHQRRLKSLA
ncbi:MAG: hypothetical protein ACYDBW_11360 [Sulfuricaulis sp.]